MSISDPPPTTISFHVCIIVGCSYGASVLCTVLMVVPFLFECVLHLNFYDIMYYVYVLVTL